MGSSMAAMLLMTLGAVATGTLTMGVVRVHSRASLKSSPTPRLRRESAPAVHGPKISKS